MYIKAKWLKSEANFFGHTLSIVANPLTMVSHAWLSIDIRGGAGWGNCHLAFDGHSNSCATILVVVNLLLLVKKISIKINY